MVKEINQLTRKEIKQYINSKLDEGLKASDLRIHFKDSGIDNKIIDEVLEDRIRADYKEKKPARPLFFTVMGLFSGIFFLANIAILGTLALNTLPAFETGLPEAMQVIEVGILFLWMLAWFAMTYNLFKMKSLAYKAIAVFIVLIIIYILWMLLSVVVPTTNLINLGFLIVSYFVLVFFKDYIDEPKLVAKRKRLLKEIEQSKSKPANPIK